MLLSELNAAIRSRGRKIPYRSWVSSDETFSEKEVLNEIENIFVFSLSSSNTSECFGELEKAVKTRNAGEKYDCF